MTKLFIVTALLIHAVGSSLYAEGAPANSSPPRVLIIGDSISMQYMPFVVEALKGEAIVKRHHGNGGPTIRGVKNIDKWLGNGKWDVIHFNWGLWDMYGWEYWKEDRSPARYKERLEALVTRLNKTGATLIWATTTPVCPAPEKTMVRRFKDGIAVISPETEKEYLDAAREVMEKHTIKINDLYTLTKANREAYALGDNDVHYNKEGRKKQAEQVANTIREAIKSE